MPLKPSSSALVTVTQEKKNVLLSNKNQVNFVCQPQISAFQGDIDDSTEKALKKV